MSETVRVPIEFIARFSDPNTPGSVPAWHLVIETRLVEDDGTYRVLERQTLTPSQAEAQGYSLPEALAALNADAVTSVEEFLRSRSGVPDLPFDPEDPKAPRVLDLSAMANVLNYQDVNYISQLSVRLHPRLTFERGVLVRREFFEHMEVTPWGQTTYSDPVVLETFSYDRDSGGFATSRTQTIQWYARDRTLVPGQKTRFKVYEGPEQLAETARRRQNIIDQLQVELLGLLMFANGQTREEAVASGQAFYARYSSEIILFRDVGDHQPLVEGTAQDLANWLDVTIGPGYTIRDRIIERLREIEPE